MTVGAAAAPHPLILNLLKDGRYPPTVLPAIPAVLFIFKRGKAAAILCYNTFRQQRNTPRGQPYD